MQDSCVGCAMTVPEVEYCGSDGVGAPVVAAGAVAVDFHCVDYFCSNGSAVGREGMGWDGRGRGCLDDSFSGRLPMFEYLGNYRNLEGRERRQ